MNHSSFLLLAFSLLLLGLFSTLLSTITGDVTKVPVSADLFEDYITFRTQQQGSVAVATGVVSVDLPREPLFCNLEGEWVTDDDPWGRQRQYCDRANGVFSGYADATQQYVLNDPNFFSWAGLNKPRVNPPETKYTDYVLYMHTCDNRYYQEPRYSVTAKVTQFSRNMEITWDYFDDDTQPAVDFFITLTCALEEKPFSTRSLPPKEESPVQAVGVEKVFYERVTVAPVEPQPNTLYDFLAASFEKLLSAVFA